MAPTYKLACFVAIFIFCFLVLIWCFPQNSAEKENDFKHVLKHLGLDHFEGIIYESGCTSIVCFVNHWSEPNFFVLPFSQRIDELKNKVVAVKKYSILHRWLKSNHLLEAEAVFHKLAVFCIEDLYALKAPNLKNKFSSQNYQKWMAAQNSLPVFSDCASLTESIWKDIEEGESNTWTAAGIIFLSTCMMVFAIKQLEMSQSRLSVGSSQKLNLLSYVTGRYLSPLHSRVVFDWDEPQVVGNTMTFYIKFYQRNGLVYPICNEDNVLVEITHAQIASKIACSLELGGPETSEANVAKVQFTVRQAGEYKVNVLVGVRHIHGSPFLKTFLPGPPDPTKTSFIHHSSTVIGSEAVPTQLFIEPKDKYGNTCTVQQDRDPAHEYSVDIFEVNSCKPIPGTFRWDCYSLISRLVLVLKFPKEGVYRVIVSYKGQLIKNGDFHIIILNQEESLMVQKNVAKKNKGYEVKLLALNGEKFQKPKKVYCYISPKQLTLKEYMWKFFPKHLITFRLCPSTKFRFQSRFISSQEDPILVIDDGNQQEVELLTSDRNVITATFTQFLLKNIGGSETFRDKQDFFNHEVRKHHQKHFHDKYVLKIVRENLLETSFRETKGFGVTEWCKSFEITFINEEGVDFGGVRREWFELICTSLFSPENMLFHTFKSDKQGLVHPCPSHIRPSHFKLKYFEFAGKIVGKCLFESSLGSSYRQLIKAKFSRSFLAQLIGLSVHYKYFEHDDPDLYVTKIKYILENDITSMGLYFTEEVYDSSGQLIDEVELIPNGSTNFVTNANKMQYLNALAQYRLSTSVKQEIESFLKGLTELIPDNLLCIFDENELELLMCGTGSYSIADFKNHHVLSGGSYEFKKVVEWFWIAVSNFSAEEMARLLQFTTGCSQLPPGGFSELNPKFHISVAQISGNLPTAHTCFNQLCLPDYDSYDRFEKALRLAITEGSEGFGLA